MQVMTGNWLYKAVRHETDGLSCFVSVQDQAQMYGLMCICFLQECYHGGTCAKTCFRTVTCNADQLSSQGIGHNNHELPTL